MVALELARQRLADITALVLIATTPSFVRRDDWPHGTDPGVLDDFASGLGTDYRRTIGNFLALQAWGDEHATQALRALRASVALHGEPDRTALAVGARGAARLGPARRLPRLALPALVISGEYDRMTPAAAGRELAAALPTARLRPDSAGRACAVPVARTRPCWQRSLPFLDAQSCQRAESRAAIGAAPRSGRADAAALTLDTPRVRPRFVRRRALRRGGGDPGNGARRAARTARRGPMEPRPCWISGRARATPRSH